MSCLFSGVYRTSVLKPSDHWGILWWVIDQYTSNVLGIQVIVNEGDLLVSGSQVTSQFQSVFQSVTLKKTDGKDKKWVLKQERATVGLLIRIYMYIFTYIRIYLHAYIYIYWKRFAEFCCFSSWSQSFSGNGFCWLARGSSQEQGNDAIYCHDPIKQAVQRVQTGCQYGGIHHLRCSSIFVETPQKHQFISSQTASARCFVQKHTSSWKNFGFNIFSIIWIFQYLNQTHATKRPPSRFRAHWWRSPRCPPSWCSWEYCPPWNWNGWRLPGMWTWQLRIPDSGWRKFPIILGPT